MEEGFVAPHTDLEKEEPFVAPQSEIEGEDHAASPTSDAKKKYANYKGFRLPTGECAITIAVGFYYIRINTFHIGFIKESGKAKE